MTDEMTYHIMGKYKDRPAEEIDSHETEDGADKLLEEYIIAFGPGWRIWIEERE